MPRRARSVNLDAGSPKPGVRVFSRLTQATPETVTLLAATAGIGLRVWQYLVNSSLWLDEAALARNIIDRAPLALLQPLDYAQVAPAGFLLVEKAASLAFGTSELALRLFPLCCGLFGIALFSRVASWALTGWPVAYAVGLFALAAPLVYFSSQLKQYSSDVAATCLVLWVVLWLRRSAVSWSRALIAASVVAGVVWFSQPVMFVAAGAGAAIGIGALTNWRSPDSRRILFVLVVWASSTLLAVRHSVLNVPAYDRAYLDAYWTGGFLPFPPQTVGDLFWVWERLSWVFGMFTTGLRRTNGGLGYPWSQVFVLLVVAGFVALWRRGRREHALIFLLPVLLTLSASALHVYPFTGRVLVFLLPIFLLTTAAGAAFALDRLGSRVQLLAPLMLAIFAGSPIYATVTALPPERIEHLRPIVAKIAAERQPGDGIYVFYGAAHAFRYYTSRFDMGSSGTVYGACSTTDLRVYLRDVDRFRGQRRVWVVATHVPRQGIELRTITEYLDAIARRVDSTEVRSTPDWIAFNAYGFLYDLSDPVRLRAASADTFSVRQESLDERVIKWGCVGPQSASGAP